MRDRMEPGTGDLQPPSKRGSGRLFGRGQPKGQENGDQVQGVATDQKLLQAFYRLKGVDAHPIATDSFLDKSRDEYNSAWLTRELVQNFVDHNPHDPGTLNGVRFASEALKGDGRRFKIEGNWPFGDPTGVLSPHSEKPENMNTAGGNGIGLKQTAIRFLRDFGVQRFEIDGEGWVVNYRLAKATDVNSEWESRQGQALPHKVRHDWLLADITEAKQTGKNAYIIETTNPEVIKALEQLPTLGVSKENPYLQNMDYQNIHGGLKWLPRSDGPEPTRGRLFINGQVMNYKTKGATAEDYWVGPEFVTVQLNNIKYKMSIDRPPLNSFDLGRYVDEMVYPMSKDDLVEQLKRSEHIWAGHVDSGYGHERQGAFVVIEKLAMRLPYKGYNTSEYQEIFPDKNYIAWDRGVSESQIKELETQGYVVCPSYMEELGMPKASSKLGAVEAASNETPQLSQYKREQFAQEFGMEVAYEDFSDVKDTTEFFKLINDRLSGQLVSTEPREGKPNTIRILMKGEIPRDLLFHSLPNPKGEDQKRLYFLRGLAAHGLDSGLFKKIFTSQGEFVTTFGLDFDSVTDQNILLARNVKNNSDRGLFVEIELDEEYFSKFQEAFNQDRSQIRGEGTDSGIATLDGIGDEKSWAPEDEELYLQAIKKDPLLLTENERLVIQRREQLTREFGEVPVTQPKAPQIGKEDNVIKKEASISDVEKARVAQMEAELPGIVEAASKLEGLIPESTFQSPSNQSATEKYLQWRQSDKFYGQLGDNAGYLTGRHLLELVNEQNQANIATVEVVREESPRDRTLDALRSKLKSIVDRMNPAEDDVNDFDIVLEPNERQLAQLGLLRLYTQLTTGVALPNDLFIYKGTGSKGINLGQKAIGMHESLFDTRFTEALRTFTHEVAHNNPDPLDSHGVTWRHTTESLFATIIDRVSQIATKLESGQEATPEERVILDMRNEWDKLIAA